ncbi:MAG: hypothetical protein QM783_19510 [Phycisphaerales bacterium]
MATLLHRLRVGGRGWRVAAWVCGVVCVLAGAAWTWSGWHYQWIGGEVNGVLIDEGQLYVTAVRKEWPDMLSVRETYAEGWRPIYEPKGTFNLVGRGGTARWRWWGRTPGLMMLDPIMPGLVRVSCPLWALSVASGAVCGACAWVARRRACDGRGGVVGADMTCAGWRCALSAGQPGGRDRIQRSLWRRGQGGCASAAGSMRDRCREGRLYHRGSETQRRGEWRSTSTSA